ncbi:SgrR family transcriptional regulator [Yersinia pseudotuberculosis]|uniref:SgrR family transcriptional regulator n=1 Tax=Yersinia pseudotuberculosis TaxID=633 RepID=UPI0003D69491|nr:SgrR family transcriptional regulator [Yersinia pseudotuberculosis]AJJ72743.1 bacterial extracellular solute-binding s, 5 Middle family protein [Yersinia pseudotuberculosis]PSH16682.1 peptide ABC transporter substrate-binding protein [Yersinia pseudotuberculosis]PSH25076.1 peptide ABC transporter substrate-binding protein [Yersinia pseudotuberculosis]PSH43678.1 peptide ABC transporter substrate-binding protein [Yersinia pseudotuberculosis]CNK25513.1 oligopeptide ABC transporter substrate-bi
MRIIHRLTQYERLYQKFGDHPVATTVADVASLLFCSERHARTLIQQLQMKSWLSWHSQVGRGKRAQLQCLKKPDALRAIYLQQFLEQGDHQAAFSIAQLEPERLQTLLTPHMGGQWQADSPILRIPYYRELEPLNPMNATGRAEQHLIYTLHAGLTRFNTGDPLPKPDLAHHWQISADGLTWQFFLRSQLRWHNGDHIHGKQLLQTLEILRANRRSQPSFANIVTITLPHALCLQFTLSQPDYWLAHRLADLPCRFFHPDDPFLGAGPFKLATFDKHLVRLKQHEFYHLQHPYLDIIEYWITPSLTVNSTNGSCQHPVRITIGQEEEFPLARPVQRSMSLGFCYLAINRHRSNLTPQQIAKLLMLVQTSGILEALSISRDVITPCHEILPGWPIPQFSTDENPSLPACLVLTYQPPMELESVAEQLKIVLAAHGCTLEIRACHDKQWQDVDKIKESDLLLADHLVGESPEATMESWLRLDPLWCGILQNEQWNQQQKTLTFIQQIESAPERFRQLQAHYDDLMLAGLILPLFNYEYQVNAPSRINGVTLTAYGWFDFCQAWLPPITN